MTFRRWMILVSVFTASVCFSMPALALPPDFNADRRVNIKCPSAINVTHEGQFELDGFKKTIRRLYHELDENLKNSERKAVKGKHGDGYAFSHDPNHGRFFVTHAKATFQPNSLKSLNPQEEISFREVFFITEIDWKKYSLVIVRQRDKRKFSISVPDFERAFIWYNALLDSQQAFIPIYGFMSLPGEADQFPTIWDSYSKDKTDTATPPESLVDYDFYKILDYREGYYLLGEDRDELDYRYNIEDFGIIGWVEKKYITLWCSRLFYHPLQKVNYYDERNAARPARETEEINNFYVDHVYLNERLFNDIVEKLDQESLHAFYSHFGSPQLEPPIRGRGNGYAKVFIPGAFTPRLMRLLGASLKRNINTFFLLDVSASMQPFADYVRSFNKSVSDMRAEGIGLRINRIFAYWDTPLSDQDRMLDPNFVRVKKPEKLTFGLESSDSNYAEPLIRAFSKVLDEIERLLEERKILPLHEKLLFIITDAGPNDLTDETFRSTVKRSKDMNLSVYFVYPSSTGVRTGNPSLADNPQSAYEDLEVLMARYDSSNSEENAIIFRKFRFKVESLKSRTERQKDFAESQRQLLNGIKQYIDHVFKESSSPAVSKDVVLFFSDEKLLQKMRDWSDRKIQVLNHVTKYIEDPDNPQFWEERLAIPAKPVEAYMRAIRTQDDVSVADLKKLVIINSLVSVDDVEKCRELYDHLKPLIERKTFRTAEDVFYKALTNRDPDESTRWNASLAEEQSELGDYLANRGFHLNAFNQAVQRKFMYLKVSELYSSNR